MSTRRPVAAGSFATRAATAAAAGTIALHWLGQAGFVVRGSGTALLVDPYLSPRPDRLVPAPATAEELAFVDGILATHEHRDHLDLPQWPLLARRDARFVLPEPLVDRAVEAGVPRERVTGAQPGRELRLGDARIVPVPARHGVHVADAYTFGQELSAGAYRYLGYVIDLDGVRVYHAGDTIGYDGQVERLRALDVDVALLPINGRDAAREAQDLVGNLGPEEAVELAGAAGARVLVPMHYEMFARNPGSPALAVEHARRAYPELTVAVLGRCASMVVARSR